MDAAELRAIQAPIKERYRNDPQAAWVTLRAQGAIDDQAVACKVETGRALAIAGPHPATGGSGAELCSGDLLLEALVACAGVTLKAVATALAIPLRGARISAAGDLDFRGTLGVAKDAPVGFAQIRLNFELDSDASASQLEQLQTLTERYCVVYQTIKSGAPSKYSCDLRLKCKNESDSRRDRINPDRQPGFGPRIRCGYVTAAHRLPGPRALPAKRIRIVTPLIEGEAEEG
jgi:uncharacterized OsmC-like protein